MQARTVRRATHRCQTVLLVAGLLLVGVSFAGAPLQAADKLVEVDDLTTIPTVPLARNAFTLVLEGQAACVQFLGLGQPAADRLVVELLSCSGVPGVPPGLDPWSLEVGVPPQSPGLYTVDVTVTSDPDGGSPFLLDSWNVLVEDGFPGAPGGVYLEAGPIDANQQILGTLVGALGCVTPRILGARIEDSVVMVDAEIPQCDCACLVPEPFAVPFVLDPLEPGDYVVQAFLGFENGVDFPLLWGTRQLTIEPGDDTTPLQGGRFEVAVDWRDYDDRTGAGRIVPGRDSNDSALFSFFERDNWELMVKVIDGCGFNDHWWVFTAAATDVEYTVTITDTDTGLTWIDVNPLGTAAPAVNDVTAFACP